MFVQQEKPAPKTSWGLTLMGGGARGLAHLGVLKVLQKNSLVPDIVVGTSMGAMVGGFYAAGVPLEKICRLAEDLSPGKFLPRGFYDFVRRRRNFVFDYFLLEFYLQRVLEFRKPGRKRKDKDKIEAYIRSIVGNVDIENLPIKFACNAADILSGREHVFSSGKLARAIRASISYPVVFSPARWRGKVLLDGGIINNAPVHIARDLGASKVMVIDVHRPLRRLRTRDIKNSLDLLERVLQIMAVNINREQVKKADFVLRLPLNVDLLDFSGAKAIIRRGEQVAYTQLEEIQKFLSG